MPLRQEPLLVYLRDATLRLMFINCVYISAWYYIPLNWRMYIVKKFFFTNLSCNKGSSKLIHSHDHCAVVIFAEIFNNLRWCGIKFELNCIFVICISWENHYWNGPPDISSRNCIPQIMAAVHAYCFYILCGKNRTTYIQVEAIDHWLVFSQHIGIITSGMK